MTAPWH
ncbi:781377c6-8965-4e36-b4e1-c5e8706740c9 [Thermothielavioides terrestris]|nr:781377c6-8965-4e36-b4e1-c5e8706740c9 [Thermothielavioides terrestris]